MNIELIRTITLGLCLIVLGFFTLRNKQNKKRNWASFYAVLYNLSMLPIINYICVKKGLWEFLDSDLPSLLMPYDIFFLWVMAWGFFPIFFLKKFHIPIVLLTVIWLDILLMPVFANYGILHLNDNWIIGEIALLMLVFIPGYMWAFISYNNHCTWLRALFQVIIMVAIFIIILPFILASYNLVSDLTFSFQAIIFQVLLIIAFPAFIGVIDLVKKGNGTPFPYDKTTNLVVTGIYAYIRNPIQWSFTLIFIPLAIYHSSPYLLIGSIISIVYTISIANVQEYADMEARFGESWTRYRNDVPNWYFLWRPTSIPNGHIYFDSECSHCSSISSWFQNQKLQNLTIKKASEYHGFGLQKVTYQATDGSEYSGIESIAHALEHINLIYATIGWFIRFPGIRYILETIIYSFDYEKKEVLCQLDDELESSS